ncbi:unnamed protein product [Prorocentrum cordatum]|uniref:HNH nuclease domain-containing protein n=1 Tax=Prorocentrum cordatum TaxID=2364126 RepID=A0ABN9UZG4_9DINO|nr:unnamed protein product [Polarella glacialis]
MLYGGSLACSFLIHGALRRSFRYVSDIRGLVSSHGRVCSRRGAVHWGSSTAAGYRTTSIGGRCVGVHRLVARAFLGPPPFQGALVNHVDSDRSNNHVNNLEYVTISENNQHSWNCNAHRSRENISLSKAVRGRKLGSAEWAMFPSLNEAARALGINTGSIPKCCSGAASRAGQYEFEYMFDARADSRPNEVWSLALHPDSGAQLAPLQVSTHGRVQSRFGIVSHGCLTAYGYRSVSVRSDACGDRRKSFYVHRIVARTFHGPCMLPGKWQVHHKDGIRTNNHIENLEFVTCSENIRQSYRMNPERSRVAGLKPVWACEQGSGQWSWHASVTEAARRTSTDRGSVSACCRGKQRRAGQYMFKWADAVEPPLLPGEEWREIHSAT